MMTLSRILCLAVLLGLGACDASPGLWENTSTADYASYCTIVECDLIETSAVPECTCPCVDDGDGCTGDNGCGEGGGGSGSGGGGGSGGGDGCIGEGCTGGDGCTGEACSDGCTLTQGYWKNHNELRSKPSQAIDWPAPMDEHALLCGKELLEILRTPANGSAWIILAHQYIAASLNVASGASSTAISATLADARTLLLANCAGITTERQVAIDLSYKLDSYNNGLIGPGHCD